VTRAHACVIAAAGTALALGACAASAGRDGLGEAQLPSDLRADYAVFAHRCSKCHLLARALNSGIDRESQWETYVVRMRRQPGSGIAPGDVQPILRFLFAYTVAQRAERARALRGAPSPAGAEPRR
jgi:hypothetical protein